MPIPWKLNVTLFGKRIFAGIVKLRVLKWGHPGLPVCTLNQLTSFLVRHRGDGHKKRMCDSRGRDRNMFSNQETPGATRSWMKQKRFNSREFGGRIIPPTPWL